jgi:type II secretion system (T2SS) protein M
MAAADQVRTRFVAAVVVLLVLDIATFAFLMSPWGRSPAQRVDEYNRARIEWHQKVRDNQPLTGMPEKLRRAEKDSDVLLRSRLPEQGSQISNEFGKLASANHVKLEQATYEAKDAELPGVERLLVKATLSADYLNLVKFINALEREKMLMVIDSLKLNEQQGGLVKVELVLEAFKKSGS